MTTVRARFLPLLLLGVATLACDPPRWVDCLVLSPECARGEANLRVDVVNLSSDVQRVTAQVNDVTRSTDHIEGGAVSLYFFDLDEHPADVEVHIDRAGSASLECRRRDVATGEGSSVTVDVAASECQTAADAGAPDAATDAGAPDSGLVEDGGDNDDDAGEHHQGGDGGDTHSDGGDGHTDHDGGFHP